MERFKFKPVRGVRGLARELLRCFADPRRHTKGAFARSGPRGKIQLMGTDPKARCWCTVGAIQACAKASGLEAHDLEDDLTSVAGRPLIALNDEHTLEELRALLRAVARGERR